MSARPTEQILRGPASAKEPAWKRLAAVLPRWSGRGRHPKAHFTPVASQELAALIAALNQITIVTDPDFALLGQDLKLLYGSASELGRSISGQVASLRETLEQTKLSGTDGLTTRLLGTLQANLRQAGEDRDTLMEMAQVLQKLRQQGYQIDRLARLLRASISSIAVESARSANCQQAFGSFVDELRQLSEKITALGEVIGSQAATTFNRLNHIATSISADLDQLRKLASNSELTVQQTSEEIRQLLESSWTVMQQVEAQVQQIGRHADQAVYHLQFGDIVRQKLEHVVTSLEEARQAAGHGQAEGLTKMGSILTIQGAQLEVIVEEIEAARTELSAAFNGLTSGAQELVTDLGQLGGANWERPGGRNPFEELSASFERLRAWQTQGRELCGRAHTMSLEASRDSQQLSSHLGRLQEINREMHIQALNAIVKTALLQDEGITLGVLSMHIHRVFMESNTLVTETVGVLEAMMRLTDQSCRKTTAGAEADAQMDTSAVGSFPATFREINATSHALVQKQSEQLRQTITRLEFLTRFAGEIRDLISRLQAFRETFAPGVTAQTAADLASLDQRYTMESERAVHRRISRQEPARSVAPATPAPAAADNFEFFDAPPAPSSAPAAAPPGTPVITPSPARPGGSNADDNIEFF